MRCNCSNGGGRTFAGADIKAFASAMVSVSISAGRYDTLVIIIATKHDKLTLTLQDRVAPSACR